MFAAYICLRKYIFRMQFASLVQSFYYSYGIHFLHTTCDTLTTTVYFIFHFCSGTQFLAKLLHTLLLYTFVTNFAAHLPEVEFSYAIFSLTHNVQQSCNTLAVHFWQSLLAIKKSYNCNYQI